ncbi:MAG TPA: DUF6089 family protein [Chitinophagaceae bacterium]|nr:DUF6089 family protein [Chitinophagaceae bacterium]
MKHILAALAAQIFLCPLEAQYFVYYEPRVTVEIGAGPGAMNSLTDLGGRGGTGKKFIGDLELKNFMAAFESHLLLDWKQALAARLQFTIGSVQAADSNLRAVQSSTFGRYERNLSFRSPVLELHLVFELHPFSIFNKEQTPTCSPYFAAGVGCFWFDPQARLAGQWYRLHPLRTEGQGFSEYPHRSHYSLRQWNFPVGLGLRLRRSGRFSFHIEVKHRFLLTDYLDDVSTEYISPAAFANYLPPRQAWIAARLSDRRAERNPLHLTQPGDQRGNSAQNDSFFTIELKLGISLPPAGR